MHTLLGEAESSSQAEVSRVDVKQAGDRQAYERCWEAVGCLATTQVGGRVKAGTGNALGLQWAAWNVQAEMFL